VPLLDIFAMDEMSKSWLFTFFVCEFILFSDSMDVAATAAGSSVIVVEVNACIVAIAIAAFATFLIYNIMAHMALLCSEWHSSSTCCRYTL
jgi:hypothetical protein